MNEVLVDRFDEGSDDDIQVEVLEEGQATAPVVDDTVSLTKDELAELKRQADATNKLTEVFGQYAKQREPVNVMPARDELAEEAEFERQIESELFTNGQSAKALKKAIEKFGAKYVADLQQKIAVLEETVVRQSVKSDPIMAEYGDEVAQYLGQLPAAERGKKQAVEWAISQVKLAHMDDIVAKKVAEAVAKTTEATQVKANTSPHIDRGGVSGGQRKVVTISPRELRVIEDLGMPKEVYAKWSVEQRAKFKKAHGIA